ncbi:uncharacterized protein LOC141600955 [Silene latifolia]|uniref:uncharacterized protein LOC141600955 n=1 Tax=Silene latifolia TaxID=37657 RepID=UPI003D77A90A
MGAKKRPASQKAAAEPEPTGVHEEEVVEIDPPAPPDWNFDPLDEEAISRIEAFLSIPEEERYTGILLGWPGFTAKDLKAGVARIAEQRREAVIPEEEEGREKELIQAQLIRSVSARIDDMDAARAQINDFSASMSSQLLSDNTFESSTKVVSILSSLVTKAAALASQAKEGLDAGLVTACQLRDAQARISGLEEKLDKVNRELHTSRGNEVVLQSQLGSAREASRAALVCEVAAKNAENVVRQELEAAREEMKTVKEELAVEKQAMQDQLRKNEELGVEKELVEARLADAAQYFFGKGRVDAMRDPESDRANWDPDRDETALDTQYPDLANMGQEEEVDSPPSKEKYGDQEMVDGCESVTGSKPV